MEMESSLFFCRVLSFYATFEYFTSCRKENVDALYCTRLCTTTVPQVESKDNGKEKHGMEGIHLHHISYKDTIRKLRRYTRDYCTVLEHHHVLLRSGRFGFKLIAFQAEPKPTTVHNPIPQP